MTQTLDRDAADTQALVDAFIAYLTSTTPQDERDVALEAALLDQGVINPSEAIEQIETLTDGFEIIGLFIRLDDGAMFSVSRGGAVHVVPEQQ